MQYREQPLFYKRFIDDGFGLWHTLDTLEKFAEYANSIHKNIKIELRYSRENIEFLDTWVHLENGNIYTSIYRQPTDNQLYLHRTSTDHPPSTGQGLAYGLGFRLRRICEKQEDYQVHRKELKVQLRKRGYSGKDIEKQLKKVDTLKREDLLDVKYKDKKEERVLSTYIFQAPV